MPTLSIFYGIKVMMYWMDNQQHNSPHFHVEYAEYEASIDIKTGSVIAGHLPRKKLKLVQAWVDLHQDELLINWDLACNGESLSKIEPLK